VVESFEPSLGQLPESITSDTEGNIYMSTTSSIWKRTPEGELSVIGTLPIAAFALGVKVGPDGCIYTVSTSLSEVEGAFVWQICEEGIVTEFAELDHSGGLNDLVFDRRGNMYITDHFQGRIWKVDPEGNAEVWLDDELLDGNPENPILIVAAMGSNGIVFDRSERHLYAGNLDFGEILRIGVNRNGTAGEIEIFASDPLLEGVDGLVFDRRGTLYAAVNAQDSVVSINHWGEVDVIETGGLLDGPASLLFGGFGDASSLYIANSAFSRAYGLVGGTPNPALLKIEIERTCPHHGWHWLWKLLQQLRQ
jgi:sugar lactone lactonase YvrE